MFDIYFVFDGPEFFSHPLSFASVWIFSLSEIEGFKEGKLWPENGRKLINTLLLQIQTLWNSILSLVWYQHNIFESMVGSDLAGGGLPILIFWYILHDLWDSCDSPDSEIWRQGTCLDIILSLWFNSLYPHKHETH